MNYKIIGYTLFKRIFAIGLTGVDNCVIKLAMSKRRIVNFLKRQVLPGLNVKKVEQLGWFKGLVYGNGELKVNTEVGWGAGQVSYMARLGQTMFVKGK